MSACLRCGLRPCGQHRSPQQTREDKEAEKWALICEAYDRLPDCDLYRNTTYKQDFCSHPARHDVFPLEKFPHLESLRPEAGDVERQGLSARDFPPWSPEEMALCRATSQKPGKQVCPPTPSGVTEAMLRRYFPPGCSGDEPDPTGEPCPPLRIRPRAPCVPAPHPAGKTLQPFSPFSSYGLDFVPHPLPHRQVREPESFSRSPLPMHLQTTHQSHFKAIHPLTPAKSKTASTRCAPGSSSFGDGPMQTLSSAAMDFVHHDAARRPAFNPEKEVFERPQQTMDTETTHSASYPWWDAAPVQPLLAQLPCIPSGRRKDGEQLVTTYREDFGGLMTTDRRESRMEEREPCCTCADPRHENEY